MGDLSELIERLEKATGPDREIDAWIGYHTDLMNDDMSWRAKIDSFGIDHAMRAATSGSNVWRVALPNYTASLDATVALIERVLPGWCKQLFEQDDHTWHARVRSPEYRLVATDRDAHDGYPTPAIALLLALLRAKEAGK